MIDGSNGWDEVMGDSAKLLRVLFFDAPEAVCEARCLARGRATAAEAKGKARDDDNVESIRKRYPLHATPLHITNLRMMAFGA
jgi:hypothetical protein